MIQIDKAIVSLDVFEKKFFCDVSKCKGICCVHGDSGAPMEDDEIDLLESQIESIKPYMRREGIEALDENGIFVIDEENDKVTPLIGKDECCFVIFEEGIAKCAIEKAYFEKKTSFRKPVSCHLYPIRIKNYKDFDAVNYDRWDVCKPALIKGREEGVAIFQFVKDALIRKYGFEWYKKLTIAADNIEEGKKILKGLK